MTDVDDSDAMMQHLFMEVAPRHAQWLTMTAQHQEPRVISNTSSLTSGSNKALSDGSHNPSDKASAA